MWQNRHNLIASTRICYCHGVYPFQIKKANEPDSTTNIQPHLTPATKHSAKSLHLSTSDVVIPNPTSTSKVFAEQVATKGKRISLRGHTRDSNDKMPARDRRSRPLFPRKWGNSQRAIVAAKAQRVRQRHLLLVAPQSAQAARSRRTRIDFHACRRGRHAIVCHRKRADDCLKRLPRQAWPMEPLH